jgi:hypothetical protein
MTTKRTTARQQPTEPAPAPAAPPERAGAHDFRTSATGFPERVDGGPAYPAAHPAQQQRRPGGPNDYQTIQGGPPGPAGEVRPAVPPPHTSNQAP